MPRSTLLPPSCCRVIYYWSVHGCFQQRVCVCGYASVLDSVFLNPTINNSPFPIYSNKSASKFNCETMDKWDCLWGECSLKVGVKTSEIAWRLHKDTYRQMEVECGTVTGVFGSRGRKRWSRWKYKERDGDKGKWRQTQIEADQCRKKGAEKEIKVDRWKES